MNSNARPNPVLPVKTKYGVAAVTGASSGLGAAIAMELATDAKALILIARSLDKLEAVKKRILEKHPKLFVHTMVCDLSYSEDRYDLIQKLSPLKVDTLVLNAGAGVFKKFFEARYEDHEQTIALNITANVDLLYHLYPTLDREARIQIITSHSSGLRIPNFAVYAAAKTFLTTWAQTLVLEQSSEPSSDGTKKDQRTISIIAAGAMATEFGERAGIPRMVSTPASAASVAAQCVARLGQSGTHYLSFYDRLIHWVNRILPNAWVDAMVARIQGKYTRQSSAPKVQERGGFKTASAVATHPPATAGATPGNPEKPKIVIGASKGGAGNSPAPGRPHPGRGRRRRGNRNGNRAPNPQ